MCVSGLEGIKNLLIYITVAHTMYANPSAQIIYGRDYSGLQVETEVNCPRNSHIKPPHCLRNATYQVYLEICVPSESVLRPVHSV